MNWTGFLVVWAVAFFLAGFARAVVSADYGSIRSQWPHRIFFAISVIIASIAVLTDTP